MSTCTCDRCRDLDRDTHHSHYCDCDECQAWKSKHNTDSNYRDRKIDTNRKIGTKMWCDATIPEHMKEHFYETFNKELIDNVKCCRKVSVCNGNHRMDGAYTITPGPDWETYSYHISWNFHWEKDD